MNEALLSQMSRMGNYIYNLSDVNQELIMWYERPALKAYHSLPAKSDLHDLVLMSMNMNIYDTRMIHGITLLEYDPGHFLDINDVIMYEIAPQ